MPNLFRKEVETLVSSKVGEITHTVQGYIPRGEIDPINWVARKLRIPNPKGGIHPGNQTEPGYLEFTDIPLPKNGLGIINAIQSLVQRGDRECTVGFKGGNLYFPIIINLLSILHGVSDRPAENTANRSNVITNSFSTAAVGAILSTTKILPPPIANTAAGIIVNNSQQAFQTVKGVFKDIQTTTSSVMDYLFQGRYGVTSNKRK